MTSVQKQPDQKSKYSSSGIAIKILLIVLILPLVIPGFLMGWSMVAQSWMERLGYAKPTYSAYTITCSLSDDLSNEEKKPCVSIAEHYGHIPVRDCQQQDLIIDGGDGARKGKVRWSVCWGIDCRETLESGVRLQQETTGLSDVIAFGFAALVIILFAVLPIVLTIRLVLGLFSSKIRMRIKARPFLHILGAIFFTLLLFPFLFIEWIQIPSDADVIEHFYNNRPGFTQLAEMLRADPHIQYISENMVLTCGSPEPENFNHYRELMNQAALSGLRSDSGQARLLTFLRKDAHAHAKFVKGYVYINSEPRDGIASLDDGFRNLPPGARLYKKIEENWYIYLEHQSNG